MSAFHDDCWEIEQVEVQASYREHVRERGVLELLATYGRHPSSSFVGRSDPFAEGEDAPDDVPASAPATSGGIAINPASAQVMPA